MWKSPIDIRNLADEVTEQFNKDTLDYTIKAAESIKKYCEKRKECHKCVFARLDEQWNITRCRLYEELPHNWELEGEA